MKKRINVTLAITVETDLNKVGDIVENLKFNVAEDSENVKVNNSEVIDFFIVQC